MYGSILTYWVQCSLISKLKPTSGAQNQFDRLYQHFFKMKGEVIIGHIFPPLILTPLTSGPSHSEEHDIVQFFLKFPSGTKNHVVYYNQKLT